MASRARSVVVIAFDRISLFHLSVPGIVFRDEGPGELAARYQVRICAGEPGRKTLRTSAGIGIAVDAGLGAIAKADIVIVPSWRDVDEPAPPALLRAIRRAHSRGATVVGLCLGAFVVAETGILDGRRATTHWHGMSAFVRRFPAVEIEPDVLYVDHDDVITSAGSAAGIDCCLHLLRRQHGAELANRVARRLVVPPHRQGGQAQYIERPLAGATGDLRLDGVLDWVRRHLDAELDVDMLASRAAMSRRSFTRHFRQRTGTSVTQWILDQRLALAQRLLETGDAPVEHVAAAAGFGSSASLREHFSSAFATNPSAWRRQFRGRLP